MANILDPAVLFFYFGALAGLLKSNLEIPRQISRFLALYLLMALGLKGGFALAKTGFGGDVGITLACAILLAAIVPLLSYRLLCRMIDPFNAAGIAAAYGSVSAVTFIAAIQFLEARDIAFGGHMAAAMALMESPAIMIAVVLANSLRQTQAPATATWGSVVLTAPAGQRLPLSRILHESFTEGSQLLLLGALAIGFVTGDAGKAALQPFSGDLFKGMLCFFLLDMGLAAARSVGSIKAVSPWIIVYAVAAPLAHAVLALLLCLTFGIGPGNGALLMTLAASASYIAVPAALRHAIPEANVSMLAGLSLGLTFPFNIFIGIPAYTNISLAMLG